MLDLAGRRELEALFDAALGLQLGHFRLLCCAPEKSLRGATLSNRHGMPFGRAIGFPTIWKARAYRGGCSAAQGSLSLRAGEHRRGNPGY
jgi:hypothetical protein